MKLTKEQSEKLIQNLNNLMQNNHLHCSVCGERQWNMNDIIIESREFQNGDLVLGKGSSVMPFITLTCANCANTIFFNAIQLGLINNAVPGEGKDKRNN